MDKCRLLNAVHDNYTIVNSASCQLTGIADNLCELGIMEPIAEKLYIIADDLKESAARIRDAYSVDLGDQISHSEAMVGNLLKAIVNGNIVPSSRE